MTETRRDLLLLAGLALLVRLAGAMPVGYPPFPDAAYYQLVASQLANGHGFSVPALWSFLEVGGHLPAQAVLPVPSNGHWMPLTSIVAAGPIALLGGVLGGWRAGQVPMILLSASLVPLTYLISRELWPSRFGAWVSAGLVLTAGPMLVMAPLIDTTAVFGAAGALSIWFAIRAARPGSGAGWLVGSTALAAAATLTRVDGLLLLAAPVAAWVGSKEKGAATRVATGLAAVAAFGLVLGPWLLRNLAVFGALLPSASGHTLWITDYNEQFSITHDPSLGSYLEWGLGNIVASKLLTAGELVGRTTGLLGGIFVLPFAMGLWRERRRRELAPFTAYFAVMFAAMATVFTFHATKGAFYHSSMAWLPFAAPLAVASVASTAEGIGRWWPFLRRPETHRFVTLASLAGAVVLAVAGSTSMVVAWSDAHAKLARAAEFLARESMRSDRVMAYDAASLTIISGNPAIAPPFEDFGPIGDVVVAYGIRWVVVAIGPAETTDPLGLWDGSAGTDAGGNHPTFLPARPSFEAPGVRVYRVIGSP